MRLRDLVLGGALALSCAAASGALHLTSPTAPAFLGTPSAWAAAATTAPPGAVADVAERAVRSVVHIAATHTVQPDLLQGMPFGLRGGQPFRQGGVGSGVIVDASGLVLTNNHVVEGAQSLVVTLHDGRKIKAHVKGTDPATDVAILQLDTPVADLPALELGDSEQARLGDAVLAIGNPFGLQGTVTMGIVSAIGRGGIGLADYEDFIQTDAAINPGNSGGALVDLQGRVIGINTAIHSLSGGYEGVGFAIPSNMAREIMNRLLADGRVVRGFLGVGVQDVDPGAARLLGLGDTAHGGLINHVEPGTPSAAAGVQVGDVVVAIDGQAVHDGAHLRRLIALKPVGQSVALSVLRDGQTVELSAKLAELDPRERAPRAAQADGDAPLAGLTVQTLDASLRSRLGLDASSQGLVIAAVEPASAAAEAGLRPGDLVTEINREPARSRDQLTTALGTGDGALLLVRRGEGTQFVFLSEQR
jgi:serine protease Do